MKSGYLTMYSIYEAQYFDKGGYISQHEPFVSTYTRVPAFFFLADFGVTALTITSYTLRGVEFDENSRMQFTLEDYALSTGLIGVDPNTKIISSISSPYNLINDITGLFIVVVSDSLGGAFRSEPFLLKHPVELWEDFDGNQITDFQPEAIAVF